MMLLGMSLVTFCSLAQGSEPPLLLDGVVRHFFFGKGYIMATKPI